MVLHKYVTLAFILNPSGYLSLLIAGDINILSYHLTGRVAQRESTAFTRQGSLVQSQSRPPFTVINSETYSGRSRPYSVGIPHWRTQGTVRHEKWRVFVEEMVVITSRSDSMVSDPNSYIK